MNANFPMMTVQTILKFGIGLSLVASGANHFLFPYKFFDSVLAYRLLSLNAAELFSFTIPFVQIITGMALVFSIALRGAWFLSGLIFCLYLAAQIWALHQRLDINCGCFGSFQHPVSLMGCLVLALLISASCHGWYFSPANKFPLTTTSSSHRGIK
jgi:hypothetical protein